MRRILMALVLGLFCHSWSLTMGQPESGPIKVLAEFHGSVLRYLRAAEKELDRKKLDLDKYDVLIVEGDESITLVLKASVTPEGERGNIGKTPGFEIEIRKADLRIIRSNYIR